MSTPVLYSLAAKYRISRRMSHIFPMAPSKDSPGVRELHIHAIGNVDAITPTIIRRFCTHGGRHLRSSFIPQLPLVFVVGVPGEPNEFHTLLIVQSPLKVPGVLFNQFLGSDALLGDKLRTFL